MRRRRGRSTTLALVASVVLVAGALLAVGALLAACGSHSGGAAAEGARFVGTWSYSDLNAVNHVAGFSRDEDLPTAHFIASAPADGWIAVLAIVTVRPEPLPADEWLAGQLARARASFAEWSPETHEMLVAPEAASLAGRPAIHVRYRLLGIDPQDEAPAADAGPVPSSLVEHWTVLVEERRWLLAMELMVQPPERWDADREALELPFRSLELI